MNRKLLSLLVTLVAMFGCLGSARAWTRSCTITVIATEGGVVFASNQNSDENAQYANSATVKGTIEGKTLQQGSITQYLFAKANEGYKFEGWSTSENSNSYVSTSANYSVTTTIVNVSGNQSKTYYAIFRKLETYYINAQVIASVGGTVYVGDAAADDNSTYGNDQTYSYSENNVTSLSKRVYFNAKADEGYKFVGWYRDENCTDSRINTANFNENVTGTINNDTHVKYYAKFELLTYYSKVTANGSSDGNVFVSAKAEVDEPNYVQSSNAEIREQAEPNPTHTYYLYAQANDGKAFQGWRNNNAIVSYDNPLKVEITNPSTSNTATSRTYTAVFGEPSNVWRWKTEEPADGDFYLLSSTNMWLKSPSNVNFEVSGNEDERTLFVIDAGNSESLKIGFEKNGSVVYMRENDGTTQEATSASTTFYSRESDGQYYIVDNYATIAATIGSWAGLVGRYFDIDSNDPNSCHFPKANTGNRTRWNFISPTQFDLRDAYVAAWDKANDLTAEQKNNLSSEAKAQLTEYLSKETNYSNASEVTAILKALCKAAEGETRSTASDKYGTICLPYAFTATGATVYFVSEYNKENSTLSLKEVENPAAGVPYIYKATDSSQRFDMNGGECVAGPVEDAYLVGLLGNLQVPNYNYVLQTKDGVQGFYQLQLPNPDDFATSTEYRCYLKNNNDFTSEAKAISFSIKETTDINSISQQETTVGKSIYTVNGVKVSSLQKGMNIIKMTDGSVKKVMVK